MHIFSERLERLRNVLDLTWAGVAERLKLSLSMLMQVKSGKRGLGARAEYRLQQAEKEAGIRDYAEEAIAWVSAAAAHAQDGRGCGRVWADVGAPGSLSGGGTRAGGSRVGGRGALADLRDGMRSLLAASERDYPLPGRVSPKPALPSAGSRKSKVRRRTAPASPPKSAKV